MNNIVFIGAGGTGVSALVFLFHLLGYKNIIAINNIDNTIMQSYGSLIGVQCIIGHGIYEVQYNDIVIYSDITAIKQGPEIQQSLIWQQQTTNKHYHRPWTYNEFIGEISKYFKTICVAGTDGKSSTTGLLIHTMMESVENFGLGILGATLSQHDNKNIIIQEKHNEAIQNIMTAILTTKQPHPASIKKYWFVLESCEYKRHFLLYDADYTIITSVFPDHMDYFKTKENYKKAFYDLISKTRRTSFLSVQAYHTLYNEMIDTKKKESDVIEVHPSDIKLDELFGDHWSVNAGLVNTIMQEIDRQTSEYENMSRKKKIEQDIQSFSGLGRRMEKIFDHKKTTLYSDYAHTPKALTTNYKALKKKFPHKSLHLFFQPHQAKRVLEGRDEFLESISLFDTAVLSPIYAAREDFAVLQQEYPEKTMGIGGVDELSTSFAEAAGAMILDDTLLATYIREKEGVILMCTAGDLDEKVRVLVS